MSDFVYFALRILSEKAVEKANELGMNPLSHSYKSLSDPRREGQYMFVVVDPSDGAILNSMPIANLSKLNELDVHNATVIN